MNEGRSSCFIFSPCAADRESGPAIHALAGDGFT
jgi:hypothetical protein